MIFDIPIIPVLCGKKKKEMEVAKMEMWRCCLYLEVRVVLAKGASFQPS
jgi:hypothetical protein